VHCFGPRELPRRLRKEHATQFPERIRHLPAPFPALFGAVGGARGGRNSARYARRSMFVGRADFGRRVPLDASRQLYRHPSAPPSQPTHPPPKIRTANKHRTPSVPVGGARGGRNSARYARRSMFVGRADFGRRVRWLRRRPDGSEKSTRLNSPKGLDTCRPLSQSLTYPNPC
jgi:hypothetical protein